MAAKHYQKTRDTFRRTAVERQGYYDCEPGQPPHHSRWQLMVRSMARRAVRDAIARSGPAERVLSVGCGRGDFEIALARSEHIASLFGCDFADEALGLAQRTVPPSARIAFLAADLRNLPWPATTFDITLAINVLHHIRATEHEAALAELARVTRRHLIIEIKNGDQLYYQRIRKPGALGLDVYPTSSDSIDRALRSHGFRIKHSRHIFGPKFLSPLSVLRYERATGSNA
jgi:SAM-dependent methyltransferase